MYEIIDNPKMMTKEEIDSAFIGKWVYIVNANVTPHGRLVEGIPVVLGEYQFEGVDEGIYERFKNPDYEERFSYTLVPHGSTISSVFGIG